MLGRRLLLSSVAALLRAAAAFILLIVAARLLPLHDFGQFMYVYTVVAVSGVIIDYGQQLSLLRNLSLQPRREQELLGRAFGAKLVLGIPFATSFGIALAADSTLRSSVLTGAVVLAGYAASSFSILLTVPKRARMDLVPDIVVAAVDTSVLCAALTVVALLDATIMGVALAFCTSKLAACLASWFLTTRPLACKAHMRGWSRELRDGIPYAAHLAVGMLFINADLLVIRGLVGHSEYGIYQAGARLVHGIGFALTVINNVFLPRWAKPQSQTKPHELKVVLLVGIAVLALLPIGVDSLAVPIVQILYGNQFIGLAPLMWIFTAIIVLRLLGAFLGVVMTLSGRQSHRVMLGVVAVATIIALNYLLVPEHGISASAYILLAVHLGHSCVATALERKKLRIPHDSR